MASAKKRQEERTDLEWADDNQHIGLHHDDDIDDDDDDDDDDDIFDDERDVVSMPLDADSTYDVISRAPPTSGQMLRSHVTDVYGPMALVQWSARLTLTVTHAGESHVNFIVFIYLINLFNLRNRIKYATKVVKCSGSCWSAIWSGLKK